MEPRIYQQTAVDSIKLGQTNLLCLPMRAGKSFVMELAIDKYKFTKVLILVGYRKIVKQLSTYYAGNFTNPKAKVKVIGIKQWNPMQYKKNF